MSILIKSATLVDSKSNLNFKKKDILIFIQSKRSKILSNLKKRKNVNKRLMNRFRNIQLSLDYKKKKSQFIINNNFKNETIRLSVKNIFTSYLTIIFISCVLEIFHLIVPNRAFELYDLIANFSGVVIVLLINSFIKWRKHL